MILCLPKSIHIHLLFMLHLEGTTVIAALLYQMNPHHLIREFNHASVDIRRIR